jgi:hypothetical protein
MPDLSKISILIRTFLRDAHLFASVNGILKTMPEAKVIIADDGRASEMKSGFYARLRRAGHAVIEMSFDAGFGAKSNAAIRALDRPYLLIGSDDFDFSPRSVREGIEELVRMLDLMPEISIASGRVNNAPYEGILHDYGDRIVEERIPKAPLGCVADLTVNYSLIRREILGFGERQVHWDDDVKIGGGEHGAFFVDVKRAGHRVIYVNGVNIDEIRGIPVSAEYMAFRARARRPERPCFAKRGIREYVLFDGTVERGF